MSFEWFRRYRGLLEIVENNGFGLRNLMADLRDFRGDLVRNRRDPVPVTVREIAGINYDSVHRDWDVHQNDVTITVCRQRTIRKRRKSESFNVLQVAPDA